MLGSVFTVTRLIKYCPYKIRVVHELQEPDYVVRIHFYNWWCKICMEVMVSQLLFTTDEMHLIFTMMVMSICKMYKYGVKNILMPLHCLKVGEWYAVCNESLIQFFFLGNCEFRLVCERCTESLLQATNSWRTTVWIFPARWCYSTYCWQVHSH